jgi:GNAT superfamily N-acetyltransferase
MSLQYSISLVSTAETLSLRQKVLKPFLLPEECVNPGDDLPTTYHLGLYHAEKLISVSTFLLESHPDFSCGCPYRLRGMATDGRYRNQGFGRILLLHGFQMLRERRCDFLWCNARQRAFPFYQSLGFIFHGELFDLPNIGPHKVMYKRLNPR